MSQYIGKTISLISVTDNRYVGLLENIDSEKGTVTLSNVRCFGTEGRKNWGPEEIFPNPTIYQSVQFNGNDVKDLSILEVRLEDVHPVLPPTTSQLPIVSPPSASTANTTAPQQQQQNQNQTSANNMEQTSVNKSIPAAVAGYGVYAPAHTIETETTTSTTSGRLENNDNKTVDDKPQDKEIDVTTDTTNVTSDVPTTSTEPTYNTRQQQQRHHYSHPHSHRPRNQKIEIPNSDFDFASSNAKFLKENPIMTLDKQETSTDSNDGESTTDSSREETFYNKKSSFFDTISTSAEINTNMRWQEERELNMDTFGQVSIRPRFHSNRGRGRGNYRGRGRGNYRGRGRGGSNNNNNYRGGYHNNNYRNNNSNNNDREFHNNFNQSNEVSSFQNQPTVEF